MPSYKLLPKQKEFFEIPHNYELDVCVYQGGYGSGKTWCGSLLGLMLARKYPGSKGLVGAKEYELVRKTTLTSYLEHLDNMNYVRNVDYTYNKIDKIIKFKNGSEILFSSLEDPEKFKSLNLHWAEMEECSQVPDSSFKQLIGRLRNTYRGKDWGDFRYRLFGHTNPQPDKGWIWKRFVENPKENFRLVIAPTSENIYLPEHFVESLKTEYDPEYYRINVLGEFGNYSSGLVVKNFTEENYADLEYNRNMDLYLCCDFNVDPMCWEIAHKDNENFYFIDELCIENTCTQHCIEEFIRRYPDHAAKIIVCGDASGNFRHSGAEFTNYMIIKQALEGYGYQVEFKLRNFNPPILNRIQAFNRQVCNANNERHVFVRKDKCQWLIYNIDNLKFKEGTSIVDVPTLKIIKNDRDAKFLEHPFDAASYPVEFFHPIK